VTGGLFPRLERPDDRSAIAMGDRSATYRELAAAAGAHARAVERLGCRPGDRIALFTEPALETAVALVSHALHGFVTVPLNPALGDRELAHVLGDAKPKLVLGSDAARARTSLPGASIALDASGAASGARRADDEPLLVIYTSGTTGAPKGAVLTARNCASNLDAIASVWRWNEADVLAHSLPLFHVHGLVLGLFGVLRTGGSVVWVPRFSPGDLGAALARATMLFGVPTMYHRFNDAAEKDASLAAALAKLRLRASGSAGLPLREHRRFEAITGASIVERYGLTETLINTAVAIDRPKPGYVGEALPGVELRLVDDERAALDAMDDATIGEVAVRGPNVFAGYLDRPDATREVLDDGWFYTGDLATCDADGSIRIVGRRSTDLVKTGGFKVGAGEVEAALLEHPSVREAAVVGRPDDDLGERIVAFVVCDPRPTAEELIAHVASSLAPHKRPREVRFVAELPRNAMGKVRKRALPG
jgi:malonyl-CoA/methylmalonyl-CoA synthetase